jgi:hypothetical protein
LPVSGGDAEIFGSGPGARTTHQIDEPVGAEWVGELPAETCSSSSGSSSKLGRRGRKRDRVALSNETATLPIDVNL